MTIGNRIRQIRKAKKMNLDQFAAKFGITGPAISMMENGKASVTDRTIADICREFNVNEQWLRTGEGDMYYKSTTDTLHDIVHSHGLNEQDYELILWFASQDDQTRKTIIDAINAIINTAVIPHEMKPASAPRNSPHEMTLEEMQAELARQYAEEKETAAKSPGSGRGNSGIDSA